MPIQLEFLTVTEIYDLFGISSYSFNRNFDGYVREFKNIGGERLFERESLIERFLWFYKLDELNVKLPPVLDEYLADADINPKLLIGNESHVKIVSVNRLSTIKNLLLPCNYLLIRDNQVVYVGRSFQPYSRIKAHLSTDKEFSEIALCFYNDFKDFNISESLLIKHIQPIYNKSHNPKKNKHIRSTKNRAKKFCIKK